LDTADAHDAKVLQSFLWREHRRGELRSGVLNFDSTRTFEEINSVPFSWDARDPFAEPVSWDRPIQPTKARFEEVIHSLLRKVRSHRESIAEQAIALSKAGHTSMPLDSSDPLQNFKDAFATLFPNKRLMELDPRNHRVHYLEGNAKLPLTALSSGEREVLSIVFDFLLRQPHDCLVFFDEPELHLHPELTERMLRALRAVGERNQFVFSTHSSEIIRSSLAHTVAFIRPRTGEENQALVLGAEGRSEVMALLGEAVGVIALGRRVVVIEGERASLDLQTYGTIADAEFPSLVMAPVGGRGGIAAFAASLPHILDKSLWGIQWFMLADGDAREPIEDGSLNGRFRLLPRYHLENYFLNETILAQSMAAMGEADNSRFCKPAEIRAVLRTSAIQFVSYAVALKVSAAMRRRVGNVDLMPGSCHNLSVDDLVAAFERKRVAEVTRVSETIDASHLADVTRHEYARLLSSLDSDDEYWRAQIPGRPLLNAFAGQAKVEVARLKRTYLRIALKDPSDPFADIRGILSAFAHADR